MSRNATGALLLSGFLLACLLVPPATGAGITLAAGQQDYYFLTGQPVVIPLAVTSSFPGAIPGTVRFSTDEQLQKTGQILISTENRVFNATIPAGLSFLNLTMDSSTVPRDYKVHVSFYYTAPSPVNASLPEFYLYIVADPVLEKNSPASLESTSLPESGEIPTSSASVVQQDAAVQEQMGSDSIGQQSPSGGRQPPGNGAQQQQDMSMQESGQEAFDALLARDPLVAAVNASLAAEGFTRQALNTQPTGNETGTFSMLYRRGAEDQAVVQGSLQEGTVPSVLEEANAAITADPVLDANTTFQSFARELAGWEYTYGEISINRTLTGAMANITYTSPEGKPAWVNATTGDNRVVQVSMEQGTGQTGFPVIPVLMLALLILITSGWYVHRRHMRPGRPVPPGTRPLPPAFDHRMEAERLIGDAERAFSRKQYADAYGLAGRALRVFLSCEYGDHGEVTTMEIISLLRDAGRDTGTISVVLGECSNVAFARGETDADEFSSLVSRIHTIIRP
jgi:hypothetical protein